MHPDRSPFDPAILLEVARVAAGSASTVAGWRSNPLGHAVENLTTLRLDRVDGDLEGGGRWSVVAKTLRPASRAPGFAAIPAHLHAQVLADLHWLDEPHVYGCGLADDLPRPLRMPDVYTIQRTGDDRVTIWMEDVADVHVWDFDRYRRTAEALGALAGSWTAATAERAYGLPRRDIARLFAGRTTHRELPILSTDEFWDDPVLAGVVDPSLRADLRVLADATPALLARLDEVPLGICHGDAAPANFHEPGDGSIVALDWSYGQVGPIGSDLAQLLAGRYEAGLADESVPEVAQALSDGFGAGLARVGRHVDPALVDLAFATHLTVRSAFSALVPEGDRELDQPARTDLLGRRARLARHAVDRALAHA